MAYSTPDPNIFYPVPPGQLPVGFVPPPPGAAFRGVPIVVPLGFEMLISPEGFPVFMPERTPPPYVPINSTPTATNASPLISQGLQQQPGYVAPTPPSRHNTVSSTHSSGTTGQFGSPPPPLPHQMPVPEHYQQQPFGQPLSPGAQGVVAQQPQPSMIPSPLPLSATLPPASAAVAPTPTPTSAPAQLTFASITSSFRSSSESITAWIFYSLGLVVNHGQKEIVITIRQRPGSYTLEQIQPIMYSIYLQMSQQIQAPGGRPLTAGDVFTSRISTPDAGVKDVSILLVHAPPECKAQLHNKDVLYGLVATSDEAAVFSKYGAARCLTNMGNDLETWPIPLWSDWSRPSLVALRDFNGSLTETVPVFLKTKNIVATLDTITHRLTLVISASALEKIQSEMRRYPPAQAGVISEATRVTFTLDLDAGAQAYLTWRTGQEGPAIFNARPNPTSFHGCWMTFSGIGAHQGPEHKESIAALEDGLELKMRSTTWERLYQALISKTPALVPVGTEHVQLSFA
ncbi:hypothetical protein BGW38_005926 [Lunasporangiospora selenospora]|uniref:Uncharacterized protein n=1 Tax=Lunasporangiospora selenospora TaxID=979761 RepID=A0A9P6KGD2_9FUNG|nr:hypothetical protein BGW38_005926 [Lunasporangiospora selenospora]